MNASIFDLTKVRDTLEGAQSSAIENTVSQLEAFERRVADQRRDLERLLDACSHIVNVCKGSRQQTRRIRWVQQRAQSAIDANDEWRTIDLPKWDPAHERLQTMVVEIFPIVKRELESREEIYEDEQGVVTDEQAKREIATLTRFIADAKRNVEAIRLSEKS